MDSILKIIVIILVFVASLNAQNDSLSRVSLDTFAFGRKPFQLKEKLAIPESLQVYEIDTKKSLDYRIDTSRNPFQIMLDSTQFDSLEGREIVCEYRFYRDILPDSIGRTYRSGIDSKVIYIALDIPKNVNTNTSLLPEGLDYSGSFGRGLTAGNSQSLVLNSTFNMQLGGKIANDIDLRAVISDANIPIQAEGTTQQLREFDQVFIELSKDQQRLVAGDYRIERPESYFINYSKKLKGISYENASIWNKKGRLGIQGSFAISGGKFSRNLLTVQEGNQGPYKLQGAENEQFIIVQSGTEKVYIDGELLTRGETNDYVIFYDRAELIFTEKRPITKDIRVIVEFEYLAQNYARTVSTANLKWELKKHNIFLNLYQENDNKNSSGLFELTEEDKKYLSDIGDKVDENQQSSIFFNDEFDPNDIFYELKITASGDTILEYSTDENRAKFQAFFTDVGSMQGSYNISEDFNTNGRIYEYVGEGNGRYLPVRKIIPPETRQLYSIRDEYSYSKNGQLKTEISMSNFDRNLFSQNDSDDDFSYAGRLDWVQKFNLGGKRNKVLETNINGEYVNRYFTFIKPFRNAEFSRDWNVQNNEDRLNEILASSHLKYSFLSKDSSATNFIDYGFQTFQRIGNYEGYKQSVNSDLKFGGTSIKVNSSYLSSNSSEFSSSFIRPRAILDRKWFKLSGIHSGIEFDGEYNNKLDKINDTLLVGSNEYEAIKTYLKTDQSKPLKASIYYLKRYDRIAFENSQQKFAEADNMGSSIKWQNSNHAVDIQVNYRVLQTDERLEQAVKDAKNLLGGIDYQYSLADGIIRGVSNLNFNSGQEPKLEFDYKEVAPGEGNFIWLDNGDGIQDKNEFQIAPFSDQGNFIQVSLFNNEFIQVYKQDYLQTLRIDPIKWKISDKNWKKKLAPLSSQTSLKVSRKDMQDAGLPDFNFFRIEEANPEIVSFLSSVNQSIYWNRANPNYEFQINFLQNKTSILLTTGNEIRIDEQLSFRYRQNIQKKIDVEFFVASKNRGLRNINFVNNNYFISGWESILTNSYRINNQMELNFAAEYSEKSNIQGLEKSDAIDFRTGFRYTGTGVVRIDSNLSFNRTNYVDDANPVIELAMLEGLKNGNNFLWEVRFTKRLINNFDLTLQYNGRKTGESNTVHVANAQIRATF